MFSLLSGAMSDCESPSNGLLETGSIHGGLFSGGVERAGPRWPKEANTSPERCFRVRPSQRRSVTATRTPSLSDSTGQLPGSGSLGSWSGSG